MRMSVRARRALSTVAAAAVIVSGTLFSSGAAHAVLPTQSVTVMASLGDSITQASMTCSALTTCSANNWSTGTTTSVNSHLLRLRAANAPAAVAGYNFAVAGAASGALNGQAVNALARNPQYVTIEIGANDACTRTVSGMTNPDVFEANVNAALATLTANGSTRQIFVASIPNLMRMYELNKTSSSARLAWALLGICQSLLYNPTSTRAADVQRRIDVQNRVDEFNTRLAKVCALYATCRFDDRAVARITASDR
jgi:lysophospholipase L1-like esterase